ncbi:hypothetical protein CgunFtcFv8_012811 [Champsocephalus gunnari]|uniref:Uncharacterized protein n=1 Tax=Champsocephalus gunnari TaxID=52237 RepID=A0AAN8HT24_CHAGU|nr:hypothetical protein CgunFtcFv8_012811 [Champsocephalus gunnari]
MFNPPILWSERWQEKGPGGSKGGWEYGLMGLTCQLRLSICLKSSPYELSLDQSRRVNTPRSLITQS